jgi:hypothetical protein
MPMPKGLFDFERHRTDVMNFLFASSDSEEDVGGESSSSEKEDHIYSKRVCLEHSNTLCTICLDQSTQSND